MNIVIILGSIRQDGNGDKVGKWITKNITERGYNRMLVDSMQLDLPILDKMYRDEHSYFSKIPIISKFDTVFLISDAEFDSLSLSHEYDKILLSLYQFTMCQI